MKPFIYRLVGGPISGHAIETPLTAIRIEMSDGASSHYYWTVRFYGFKAIAIHDSLIRHLSPSTRVTGEWSVRSQIARMVQADPDRFMVCASCDSITSRSPAIVFCDRCKGYQFLTDRATILEIAEQSVGQPPEWTLPTL